MVLALAGDSTTMSAAPSPDTSTGSGSRTTLLARLTEDARLVAFFPAIFLVAAREAPRPTIRRTPRAALAFDRFFAVIRSMHRRLAQRAPGVASSALEERAQLLQCHPFFVLGQDPVDEDLELIAAQDP